jgi:hypothetical protein
MKVPEEHQEWEDRELKDGLSKALIDRATARASSDHLIAIWRDKIHNSLMEAPTLNIKLIHDVLDCMDQYLYRSRTER